MKRPIAWMALGGGITLVLLLSFALTLVGGRAAAPKYAMAERAPESPPPPPMAVAPSPEPAMEMAAPASKTLRRRLGAFKIHAAADAKMEEVEVQSGGEGYADGVMAGGIGAGSAGGQLSTVLGKAESPAPTRAWFPETFLFEPLVVTSDRGEASVPVKVPDRLTSWRVLALAHSRSGGQGGAVASFASTLPTYVDPVLPPFLTAGDEVRIPVQVVNTTAQAVSKALEVKPEGDLASGGGAWTVSVPAQGSVVQYASISVREPGHLAVRASLGGADQVVRALDVLPAGRPVRVTRGGTLAAPRELNVELPAEAMPRSERARLLVYPGSLALVRSELAVARHRPRVADDAYALALVARAPALLRALGEEPDAAVLKELKIVLSQRAVSHGRAPPADTAALLAEAALGFPDDRSLSSLGERLAQQLANQQSPDGTCQGETGWTEQRLLVATAECLRAIRAAAGRPNVKARAQLATVRASGAYERALPRIDDPYTAAAALASGAVPKEAVEPLRAKVRAAIKAREDGSRYVVVPRDVQRSDGTVPSEAEATAYAVLALQNDGQTPIADLGATLLGSYSPAYGWGDGRANLVALAAVANLFKDKVPDRVSVVLKMDGQVVAEGVLDAAHAKEVLVVEAPAPGAAGSHRWTVQATPAVPGLGFSLQLAASIPWKTDPTTGGLELQIAAPTSAKAGEAVAVSVLASSAAGAPMEIHHALPAGVQVDTASLEALREGATPITSYESRDGELVLHTPQLTAGQPFRAAYKVIPTLQGTLHAGASSIALEGGERRYVAPAVWTVR